MAMRTGDGPESVLDFAGTSSEEAEIVLGVLDEVETEERAASITSRMRAMGHTL